MLNFHIRVRCESAFKINGDGSMKDPYRKISKQINMDCGMKMQRNVKFTEQTTTLIADSCHALVHAMVLS